MNIWTRGVKKLKGLELLLVHDHGGMPPPSQLLAALRATLRLAHPSRHLLHSFRSPVPFSRSTPFSLPSPSHHRALSLPSIQSLWTRANVVRTPSPEKIATIARLESDANATPHDVAKQVLLFRGLADSKVKAGYNMIISRWERMCTFDPTSPLLRSDLAFELYLAALNESGLQPSIDSAVRSREFLLASTTPSADPSPAASPVETVPTNTTTATTTTTATDATTAIPPQPSRSQAIAQAVMAGKLSAPSPISPELVQLAEALGRGAGTTSDSPIHVAIGERRGAWLVPIIKSTVIFLILGFLALVLMAVLLENSGLLKAGPRQPEFEPLTQKTVKFTDVHGVDEVKEELKDVVEFLKDPTIFATLGGKLPKGVLLTGPPGTGKTMLARAVAGEAGVPFLFSSGSEFEEMFVGVGAKRVRDLFAAARKKQPAIIFIDELDAVGGKRSSRDQQYMKQTLNQLLVEMDGFLQTEGVIVIAATNFPESLDPALMRPGRFDKIIAVPLPDIRGRVQILQHHMRDVVASEEADPTILARGTSGFSGADLENLVNQAAIQASKQGFHEIMLSHFEWAKDRIIMGSERKSAYIDEKNKLMTAYHEGGHALAVLYTEGAIPLHKVTCVPRGHSLGMTTYLPEADRLSVSLKEYNASIDVCMGGRVAEAIIYGIDNVTSGASSDLQQATRMATAMVKNFGFSQKIGPVYYSDREETIAPQTKENIDTEIRRILQAGEERVHALLKSKEHELHLLARALVEHETLDADEVRKVIKGEPIRNIKEIFSEDLSSPSTESTPSSLES